MDQERSETEMSDEPSAFYYIHSWYMAEITVDVGLEELEWWGWREGKGRGKKLGSRVAKSHMMLFRQEERKRKTTKWEWKNGQIDKVNELKYLG